MDCMKYVFFDIECACVYKSVAKMCAFGYVVTDENFNVLDKEDVLLNPRGKFHLTGRKGGEGLVLPYEYEVFKEYPTFPTQYPRFKALLEDKDAIVCGHATLNDVNYLNLETRRYKLPSFCFSFYDTQFFYMNVKSDFTRQVGLQGMAEELGVEFVPHRAADDAYATMRVCQVLCAQEGKSMIGLCERYGIRAGSIKNYTIRPLTSRGLKTYMHERDEAKEQHAKAHEEFYRFVNKNMRLRKKGGSLEGKVFCFAKDIEDDVAVSTRLIEAIYASGGCYTSHPSECNVYIAREEGGLRFQNALTAGAAFIPLGMLSGALEN